MGSANVKLEALGASLLRRSSNMSDPLSKSLQEKKLQESLSRWLAEQIGWSVSEVTKYFSVSRKTVEAWPAEVLPFTDVTPASKRETRRYRPRDVYALDGQGWVAAEKSTGRPETLNSRGAS